MEKKVERCTCCHSHEGEASISPVKKLRFSIIFIVLALFASKPFLYSQVFKRGCAYLACPLYDDAIRQYKKALFLNRQSDDAWDWLGYAYKSKGDVQKAIECYEEAIKVNPDNIKAHFGLGMIYLINKNFDTAAGHFRYIIAMGKEKNTGSPLDFISYHRSSCDMLIACYEKMGKKDQMFRAAKMTVKLYPDDKKAKDKLLHIEDMPK